MTSSKEGTNIHHMKSFCIATVLCYATVCVAQAATEEEVCAELESRLAAQVELLSGVTDAPSAAAAVNPLNENLAQLAALNNVIPSDKLWSFIDNNLEVKLELIEQLQLLSVQYYRLQQESFYSCAELERALTPYLKASEAAQ